MKWLINCNKIPWSTRLTSHFGGHVILLSSVHWLSLKSCRTKPKRETPREHNISPHAVYTHIHILGLYSTFSYLNLYSSWLSGRIFQLTVIKSPNSPKQYLLILGFSEPSPHEVRGIENSFIWEKWIRSVISPLRLNHLNASRNCQLVSLHSTRQQTLFEVYLKSWRKMLRFQFIRW